ncbi:hypothetical protein [Pseudomonas sp. PAMC 26793]|uniref:hypothetical protein n=1 Tax=Pseudomonas sp. PAMC 26793 TaxID=1240676 RepID=UPI0003708E60|nr:hypothetical protein [Pseudomonas sp. PAMC 26793]
MSSELNDLTTFDNFDMNGWHPEGAPSKIERSGNQYNLVRHASPIPFFRLSKSLPLESHSEYAFRFTGEGRHRVQLTITVPSKERLVEREVTFQGLGTIISIPITTGPLKPEDKSLILVWTTLAEQDQDRTFKLGELHIIGVPPER